MRTDNSKTISFKMAEFYNMCGMVEVKFDRFDYGRKVKCKARIQVPFSWWNDFSKKEKQRLFYFAYVAAQVDQMLSDKRPLVVIDGFHIVSLPPLKHLACQHSLPKKVYELWTATA
ncbi:hypothetical protein [Janthinobacterium sp. B9-8]|uniref:hypothetical protein n=1 Tax=Janthinobacterium sp. B9-8 TaxID=1236179 RepID=UPI00061D0713|nr:hypothetical protein [Janthinobacterium sp. B9-8]AMC34753.1 hypothetical protein VN23_09095 [Janthinobacterium sp. B9-8]